MGVGGVPFGAVLCCVWGCILVVFVLRVLLRCASLSAWCVFGGVCWCRFVVCLFACCFCVVGEIEVCVVFGAARFVFALCLVSVFGCFVVCCLSVVVL